MKASLRIGIGLLNLNEVIAMDQIFFRLENAFLTKVNADIGLNSRLLEKEMIQYNGGIDISKPFPRSITFNAPFREFHPHFYNVKGRNANAILDT